MVIGERPLILHESVLSAELGGGASETEKTIAEESGHAARESPFVEYLMSYVEARPSMPLSPGAVHARAAVDSDTAVTWRSVTADGGDVSGVGPESSSQAKIEQISHARPMAQKPLGVRIFTPSIPPRVRLIGSPSDSTLVDAAQGF